MNLSHLMPNAPVPVTLRRFYECGCCGAYHSDEWYGDCRQNNARFFADELDAQFGFDGWTDVTPPSDEWEGEE